LGVAVVAITTVLAGVAPAAAAAGDVTKNVEPVSFTLSSEQCPNLPADTTIVGTGTLRSVTHEMTSRNGVTTRTVTATAAGTAVDDDGNRYHFAYSNHYRGSTSPDDTVFSGRMTDHFSLSGPGPARLNNGFIADFTINLGTFTFEEPIHEYGDPLSFPEGAPVCDPL
jgi:hypothetical protein